MSALQQILKLAHNKDPFRESPDNLYQLQLQAAGERFAQRRQQIKLLDRRAKDAGIDEVRSREDLVPLLFADANYKSYPDSFLDQKRWDRMTLWLQTLSTVPIVGMNYDAIQDMDDWVAELRRNGHYVVSSSGTSGRQSFLNQSESDREMSWQLTTQAIEWAVKNFRERKAPYPVFALLPSGGSYTATERTERFIQAVGKPDDIHYMSYVPQSAQDLMTGARLKREMAAGTAKPNEIAAFEARTRERQTIIQREFADFRRRLLERRHEPQLIIGMLGMLYTLVAEGKAQGIVDGDFHPDTVFSFGGGKKGLNLPEDFQDQCYRFFNLNEHNFNDGYGMAEMSGFCPTFHKTGGWVIPPWIVPLVLDKTGEQLLNPENGRGEVEGRFAFIDLLVDGRWGGMISGDKVRIDFSCDQDGIRAPLIKELVRYKDLPGGVDKLSCAGTIDAYIRGAIED
ncbi:hypothetical protein [Pseudomonas sp. MIACH]|uniref:hypothetical protein n=1 Tax=Pseudomonas sp. MIACH TaxID=1078355 RepID=UPI00069CFDAB|nr:hypothetical protein [Pseudomonas sp. MIACH]